MAFAVNDEVFCKSHIDIGRVQEVVSVGIYKVSLSVSGIVNVTEDDLVKVPFSKVRVDLGSFYYIVSVERDGLNWKLSTKPYTNKGQRIYDA